MTRYNHLNEYLKNKFGERVLKICIDGGFTCPNRLNGNGCIFCGEEGAGELIKGKYGNTLLSIKNQVTTFLNSYRGERANKFIAYFQSFSGTFDTIANLREKYNAALSVSDKIIGLQIATRPDLINQEVIDLLKEYSGQYYVCVELGLQTASDEIGILINRGYTTEDFINACQLLKKNNIDVVGHMMIGLPNECEADILKTIEILNMCNGVKIHSTFVLKNTLLEKMYLDGEYVPITQDYYVDRVCDILSRLNKNIIIHRINGDPPKDKLVAPEWTARKKIVLNKINNRLEELDITQGCLL